MISAYVPKISLPFFSPYSKKRRTFTASSSPLQFSSPGEEADLLTCVGRPHLHPADECARTLLLRLDTPVGGPLASRYEHPVITVEHVLPRESRAGVAVVERFSRRTRDESEWTHRLANLVLLSRTKKCRCASNYDFDLQEERRIFRKGERSPFALTSQVLTESDWTPEVLERRQRKLLSDVFKKRVASRGGDSTAVESGQRCQGRSRKFYLRTDQATPATRSDP